MAQDDLAERIKQKLGNVMNMPPNAIDLHQKMTSYGVDSLMAIELITWAKKELDVNVNQLEILNGMTGASLLHKVAPRKTSLDVIV